VQEDFYSGTRHLIGKIFAARLKTSTISPKTSLSEIRELVLNASN